jgi:type 1 glutamine amidotransferase
MTGYQHWTTPHTEALIKIMAEKSGRFEVTTSTNIKDFEPAQLNTYDAIVLNNTCSKPADRNIFLDVLRQDVKLNEEKALEKAESLEKNLLQFVDKGKGLVILHGGITMLNKSKAFSNMVGGSFDYHPPQQPIEVHLVDPQHPMLLCFDGQGFEHVDEPYFFNKAYSEKYFKPLLYLDASAIQNKREATVVERQYLSWIKPHGAGRGFYASMSHNPQSYEHPALVKYLLNGLDYAVGYLQCDDTPMEK